MSPPKNAADAEPLAQGEADPGNRAPHLPFPIVGVGASAGGLEAFSSLVEAMPADNGIALVLIQHLPPERDSLIAAILGRLTKLPVVEITDGLPVSPNGIYVIQPGFTVTLRDGTFHLGEPLEKRGHRHPVDDFFRSLALEQKERAVGIVLSGMGSNGSAGAQEIRSAGGMCIAQEPASAKFPSMPESLIRSGAADFILRAEDIPALLVRYVQHPYVRGDFAIDGGPTQESALAEILKILRNRGSQDFGGYKKPTLVRRIERRMGLRQVATMPAYVKFLASDEDEVSALANELLIHVTGFFRDPDVWEVLREKVVAPLVAIRNDGGAIRGWVSACSTGEESYTLAMVFLEEARRVGKHFDIKIFATDVAGRAINSARDGVYPAAIEDELPESRLAQFFDREDETYRAKKELRETIVFAPQDLLRDPPFSRLDICTCRNFLIYLEPSTQLRVLGLMHFALQENGCLLLGASEAISGSNDLFEPIDKKARIFRRLGRSKIGAVDFPLALPRAEDPAKRKDNADLPQASVLQLTQRTLANRYAPASVVIDRQQRVIFFHGPTERFMVQPAGEPTREILSLARDALRASLRRTIEASMSTRQAAKGPAVTIDFAGRTRVVEPHVAPLDERLAPDHFLVVFEERLEAESDAAAQVPISTDDRQLLETELSRMREELQGYIAELQSNNEEMKASAEEAISMNEELQSTNEELATSKEELATSKEELATSKEELQSLNEELTTVNAQLQSKMVELEGTTNDLSSLLSSIAIGVIFLDNELCIRRFAPAVRDLVDLIADDVGRPLKNFALKADDPQLLADAAGVIQGNEAARKEISADNGRTFVRSVLPYRAGRGHIEGVVITFIDITDRERAERALRQSEEQHRLMLESLKEYSVFLLDEKGIIATWPKEAEKTLGYSREEALGHSLDLIIPSGAGNAGLVQSEMEEARVKGSAAHEGWRLRKDGSRFWGSAVLSAVRDENGRLRGYVKVLRDQTDRRLAEEALEAAKTKAEEASVAKDQFLATVSHELMTPMTAIVLWANLIDEEEVKPDQLREALAAIRRGVEEQRELIEDLVDTARIAAGKMRLDRKPANLVAIARELMAAVGGSAAEKRLRLERDLSDDVGMVDIDASRMRQVVGNLLTNAIKFTDSGGKITLQIERKADDVIIRVSDTGHGFTPEFQTHLFTRFEQEPKAIARANGGLGIGLSIAKQIVILHGGTISGTSEGAGRGATFIVRLPLPSRGPIPAALALRSHGGSPISAVLRGMSVLVVEDSPATQRALAAVLEEAGADVITADTAPSALQKLAVSRPDVIVSDVGLPDVDGLQFIAQVRKSESERRLAPVPALALTAFAGEHTERQALGSGFQQCLSKPVEPAHLVTVLATLASQAPSRKG